MIIKIPIGEKPEKKVKLLTRLGSKYTFEKHPAGDGTNDQIEKKWIRLGSSRSTQSEPATKLNDGNDIVDPARIVAKHIEGTSDQAEYSSIPVWLHFIIT